MPGVLRATLNVLTITASMRAPSMVRGAPERGSSCSPATRCSIKRRRHLPTVCRSSPSLAATSVFCPPSARVSTIRALRASACAVFRRIVSDVSSARSSSLDVGGASCRTPSETPSLFASKLGTVTRIYCDSIL